MNKIQEYHVHHKKKALEDLKSQISKPSFPMSLWEAVLLNQYVDLNKIYSIQEGHTIDEETVHKSGQFKFVFNQAELKWPIYDQGGWSSAFECYADTVTFAYSHQVTKLQAYRQHIRKLFSEVRRHNCCTVILFDQKFCKELAGDAQLMFDDVESSQSHLYGSLLSGDAP